MFMGSHRPLKQMMVGETSVYGGAKSHRVATRDNIECTATDLRQFGVADSEPIDLQ